jgi:NADPH:quinone reductase-like Zn-dependent oxidoreductase
MKAIRIHQFGDLDVLELDNIAIPKPHDDEVLIKVYASSVNPVDQKIVAGEAQEKFPSTLPLTIGWDVSGVIEQAGDKVHNLTVGDEVYSRPYPTTNGAFAEYVLVKANQVSLKPKSIGHLNAAAVPLAGLTAWQGLFKYGQLEQGQKVLIHAASGGVGTFAIQFAKWKGAYVIGTASEENLDRIRDLGVDEAINYKNERFEEKVHNADLVFDLIGGDTQKRSLQVLKEGGRLITTVKVEFQHEAEEKHIHIESFTSQSVPEDLKQIADLIDGGFVKPVVSVVMNLKDAKQAEMLSEDGGGSGKIVIKVV